MSNTLVKKEIIVEKCMKDLETLRNLKPGDVIPQRDGTVITEKTMRRLPRYIAEAEACLAKFIEIEGEMVPENVEPLFNDNYQP